MSCCRPRAGRRPAGRQSRARTGHPRGHGGSACRPRPWPTARPIGRLAAPRRERAAARDPRPAGLPPPRARARSAPLQRLRPSLSPVHPSQEPPVFASLPARADIRGAGQQPEPGNRPRPRGRKDRSGQSTSHGIRPPDDGRRLCGESGASAPLLPGRHLQVTVLTVDRLRPWVRRRSAIAGGQNSSPLGPCGRLDDERPYGRPDLLLPGGPSAKQHMLSRVKALGHVDDGYRN